MTNSETSPPGPESHKSVWTSIRNRVLSGLLLCLPFVVTFWILSWLYRTLRELVIDPMTRLVLYWIGRIEHYETSLLPPWFTTYVAPVVACVLVVAGLYFLGMLVRSKLHHWADQIVLRVPLVTTVYSAVRNIFATLQQDRPQYQRVVLVAFPHPGMRVPAFVTSSTTDVATGRVILCVYVPTTPVPTSGYMLMVPEEEVVEISWTLDETLQAIISGGITVPGKVEYTSPGAGGTALPAP